MTITMNPETPVNGVNFNDVSEIINGIDNGICTVSCVTSTTSVDAAGEYRITRRLECVWANKDVAASDRILDLEISGTQGTTPVVTLNGQVLPTASVILAANGALEIRNLKGMLIDRVQLPIKSTATVASTPWQGLPYQNVAPIFGGLSASAPFGYGPFVPTMNTPFTPNTPATFAPATFGINTLGMVKKPFLGIAVRPVSGELIHHIAVDARNVCVVSDVIAGSPAFAAGLEPNDVILGINGKQASLATLRHELDAAKCGQVVRLAVLGKGVKREIDILLDGNFAGNGSSVLPMQYGSPMYCNIAEHAGTTSPSFGVRPMGNWMPYNKPLVAGLPINTGYNCGLGYGSEGACYSPSMNSDLGTTPFAAPRSGSLL